MLQYQCGDPASMKQMKSQRNILGTTEKHRSGRATRAIQESENPGINSITTN